MFAALALAGALPAAAHAATPNWRDQLGAAEATQRAGSAADAKRALIPPLRQYATHPLSTAVLDAVTADAAQAYADGDRPKDQAAARRMFVHDAALALGLEALLIKGVDRETLVASSAQLLASDRKTAQAIVDDGKLLSKTSKDRAIVEEASKALTAGTAAWKKGLPTIAVASYGVAVEKAWGVLDTYKITYGATVDRDRDNVPDILELRAGADPRLADTDGDGLSDRWEIERGVPYHMPGLADTDGDGIKDGLEDTDEDGLNALGELRAGTNPLEPDSDGDGLRDGPEVNTHKTNPLKPDTDGDTLSDAAEIRGGTNPLKADSDGDGIRDDAETVTATAKRGDVTVELTGTGDLAGDFTIAPLADDALLEGAPGQVGEPVELSLAPAAKAGFKTAKITLPYDEAKAGGDEADLRLFTFNEEYQLWVPSSATQTVDPASNTVTATVDHFSIYAVFNIKNWQQTWTATGGSCDPRGGTGETVYLDVALVLDSSGSMDWNDPQYFRRGAAKNFVDAMLDNDEATIVDFDDWARIVQPLTKDKAALKAAIDSIDNWGGTDIGAGVSLGLQELATRTDPARAQIMILLTDGVGAYDPLLTVQAGNAGVTIYTIALGTDTDESLLREIATQTGGSFTQVDDASDLPEVFREISEDNGDDGTDTDGDGLTDCEEERPMRDSAGYLTFTSDPRLADTDGDGLEDGQEIGPSFSFDDLPTIFGFDPSVLGSGKVYAVYSDPRLADTDADGLTDAEEADFGSRARSGETDGDGMGDYDEMEAGTDPTDVDTDGDGRGDGWEDLNRAADFDPLVYTEEVSKWTYAGDFTLGALCGELVGWCEKDSVAWLAGNISGGFFVVTDIRDAIGNLFSLDFVGAGVNLFGAIPLVGDAAGIVAKAVKFVRRVSEKAGATLRMMMKIDQLPQWAKLQFLDEVIDGGLGGLRRAGLSDSEAIKLAAKGLDLRLLDDAVQGAARVFAGTGYRSWRSGETALQSLTGGVKKGFAPIPKQRGTAGYRFVDSYNAATGVAAEAKTGFAKLTPFVQRQIDKDKLLLAQGRVTKLEWHFYPSSRSGTVGPSRELLDELKAKGIDYIIHLP